MTDKMSLVLRLIASSITAANQAGKIIRDVMSKGELGIVEKGKNDLQTEADRSAQQCIIASLSLQFPHVKIIGEEGASNTQIPKEWIVTDCEQDILKYQCPSTYTDVTEQDVVIWVDPLDGTSEYTQGLLDHVTVLVGIAVKGKAIGGVIHQPYYRYKIETGDNIGRTLWGLVGLGVGGFTPQRPPPNKFIVTTTRSHLDNIVQEALDALQPTDIVKVGGAGNKVLLLLEGCAHAYVFASAGCKKWDTCAPEAILTAAGGRLTDMRGQNYSYNANVTYPNEGGVFATAPGIKHSLLLSKIPISVLDVLK